MIRKTEDEILKDGFNKLAVNLAIDEYEALNDRLHRYLNSKKYITGYVTLITEALAESEREICKVLANCIEVEND